MSEEPNRVSAAWFVPIAILVVVVWVLFDVFRSSGVAVTVTFSDGHAIAPGDRVRCRGIDVGTVDRVVLDDEGVEVWLDLDSAASSRLARKGSRWWISRPEIGWSRVSGLDSLVGPRFIQVEPPQGDVAEQFMFTGLEEAPIIEQIADGDLPLVLMAETRGTLRPGSAVLYRGVKIGTIQATSLADDATSVEVRALVRAQYAPLVRTNSKFFQTGALDVDLGLTGLRARLDSLETLFVGGVTLATPNNPGDEVKPGAHFNVAESADDDWLEWKPAIELK